ncbi:MAG: hypothetical protein LBB40_03240 [Holophagales bacterium]|jgi:predicted nuclease with TOPRIM domain|nr:hypothetical protein [Holophagales bacterium]
MSVGFEWLLGIVIMIVGALVGAIWKSLNGQIEKIEAAYKHSISTVWDRIDELRKDVTEIKEQRGTQIAELENIKERISEIPNHKELCEMFRESEARMESRLITLLSVGKK